jgi:flagellin-like protein
MRKNKSTKKGVSPVIAVLLMVAIAVAAAILVYVWSMGIIGTLTGSGGGQVKEQLIMDAYNWQSNSTMTLYMRNVGSSSVIVDAIYVGGSSAASNMGSQLALQTTASQITVTLPPTQNYTPGVAYTVKVITKTGGVFSFSVICGSAS